MQAAILDHRSADGDGHVGITGPADVADRAGVDVALDRFQLADDFQRADLRRATDRAGRKRGAQHVHAGQAVLEIAFDLADDVHDVGIAFDDEAFGELDAAGAADPADIVAAKIDQHQVLGTLLGICQQLGFEGEILLRRFAAWARAGQWPQGDLAMLLADKDLRR